MTISFEASSLNAEDLQESPLAPPIARPLAGPITTRGQIMFSAERQGILAGVWECERGTSRWEFHERGEFIHVLSGRMTVRQDDGEPLEITAGHTALFPIGWTGIWEVHETLRKVYVVFRAE
ncbi:cupin domain-containing protein [Actinomadura coerulea]|uniref:cupin domain-containing protein n=1 Tax=Actinomadura coerulea TaxID=46159 RepID=UPI003439D35E